MAEKCTDSSDDGANVDGLRCTEIRESGDQSMVGAEFDSTFGTKSWREDTAFVVEERRIYVSRGVLSLMSPVFTQMFEEKIKDSDPMEIQLEGKKHGDMIEFLKCIYPNIMQAVTLENVFVVLPLAVEFGIDPLKERCENALLENTDDYTELQDICMYLSKAFKFSMSHLQNECIDVAARKSFTALKEAEREFPLPVETKLEIQGKMIEKMELRMLEDTSDKCPECSPLKKAFEALKLNVLLNESIDVSKMKNPRFGYLEYSFSGLKLQKVQRSATTTVHGITWCILVKMTQSNSVGLFLAMNPLEDDHPTWKCKARATLRLRNYKNDEKSITRTTDHVFTESEHDWGYSKFSEMEKVMDSNKGFIKDGKVTVDICFLVEEPTSE